MAHVQVFLNNVKILKQKIISGLRKHCFVIASHCILLPVLCIWMVSLLKIYKKWKTLIKIKILVVFVLLDSLKSLQVQVKLVAIDKKI